MSEDWNRLLDYRLELNVAATRLALVGGDERLLAVTEELLRGIEDALEDPEEQIGDLKKQIGDFEEQVAEKDEALSRTALLIADIDGDDYRHADGHTLKAADSWRRLVALLA